MNKKVLIITYYWPPAGGISVLRCLKFAKYLKRQGWEPIIYKPSNADYFHYDENNFKDIPDEITILEQPINEPFNLFKKLTGRKKNDSSNPVYARDKKVPFIDDLAIWIRGNFFIPDARFMWIKPSVEYLKKFLINHPVDAILTDGPPHTNTVIACQLSKELNIPWLADFQDPWTQVDYYKMLKIGKRADKKHRKMEQDVFKTAKKITIASPTWANDLEEIGAKNVDVIFWGYDEDDFRDLKNNLDSKFTIYHGGILGFDRNPEIFFNVLADLKNEIPDFSSDLEIKLAGNVDVDVLKSLKNSNLEENLNNLGFIKRHEALQCAMNARLLLLPVNKADNAKGRIPGKLFELLRTSRPIIGLGIKGGDVENIILKCNAGVYLNYDDYNEIKEYITNQYFQFKKGNMVNTFADVEEYSIENQTKKISRYLDSIVNNEEKQN